MKIIKPDNLALLFSPCMIGDNCCLSVAAMACFSLDPAPVALLLKETAMWKTVAAELGEEEALDTGYPKQRGEYLVYGSCHASQPVTGLQVNATVAGLSKTLNVSGARYWNAAGIPSVPEPFQEMPVRWTNAFGGLGWEPNPVGMGLGADETGRIPVPPVQDPQHQMSSPNDCPEPAGFNALNPFGPQRKRYLGTFNHTWLKNRWPHYPHDTDPEYFNTAPMDQRISGFFKGDELLRIGNMHPLKPEICSVLPGVRARVFINRVVDGQESFVEISTRAETVWLFPGSDCGILLFRGTSRVTDETLDDVTHLMAEWELLRAEPETLDFYHQKFLKTVTPAPEAPPEPPPPVAAPPAPKPKPPPAAPEPPQPPPLPPDAEKLLASANEAIAKVEAQVDAAFAKLGMTREEVMAKYAPPPKAVTASTQAELEKMIADVQQQADAAFKKLGMTQEEATQKYLQSQPTPKDIGQEITKLTDALQGLDAKLQQSGTNLQEAAAKVVPNIDPAALDINKMIAGLTALAASIPSKAEAAPEPPESEEAETEIAASAVGGETEVLDSVDAVMKHHASGKKLSGLDLSRLDFSGRDLSQADFSGSTLVKTNFRDAVLQGALFADALLADADFSGAQMGQARLIQVQAVGAKFPGANLQGADLSAGNFSSCDFSGADFTQAILSRALFSAASLKNIKGTGLTGLKASFPKADLSGANLRQAILISADFTDATLDNACFSQAEASRATFGGAHGKEADFSGAKMQNSRAGKTTDLSEAIFSGADLTRSCWERASLTDARMAGTLLDNANFCRVKLDRVYLVNAIAKEANFMKAVMTDCDLRGVNFFNASFRHAKLNGCDLKSSSMFGADLYGAKIVASDIQGTDFRRAQARSAE